MRFFLLVSGILIGGSSAAAGKDSVFDYEGSRFERNGYVLHFTSNAAGFSKDVKKKMIEAFFVVYPRLVADFNARSAKEVYFKIDTAYKGVAATGGGNVVYSPEWFARHPDDIDVVTHEVMHIVQDYGRSVGPWWITEGIADYIRFKYGVNNEGAGWKLPGYTVKQKYTDSYRVTARFLAWIESKVKPGTVKALNKALREHTYTPESWEQVTGKSIDDLWAAYTKDPVL
ncbi:basic secretory family protein [Niabella sp. 3A5MI-3]|nr:basic secretory protein-like protein [Niabella beijingensis]MBZ4188389.1 basic secretory family protein [Niabella beijingensis]